MLHDPSMPAPAARFESPRRDVRATAGVPAAGRWQRKRRAAALGLALLLIGPGVALAQSDEDWQLRQEDLQTQTRVWLRPRPDGVPAFRATTVIPARLSSLAAVLLDDTRTPEWVYRARQAVPLSRDGPTRGVTLVITRMPFPLADRESIVAWEMTQDARTHVVTLAGRSAPQALPPHPERVRMPQFESQWMLAPRPDGQVDVSFSGVGDPGGNLSGPVLRQFVASAVWEAPWFTVHRLREMVRKPEFVQAQLPFIREPGR